VTNKISLSVRSLVSTRRYTHLRNWQLNNETKLNESINNFMQQIPFWAANSFLASQEIPLFYGTKHLLRLLEEPALCFFSEPDQFNPNSHTTASKSFLILSSHAFLGLPSLPTSHQAIFMLIND
jgi:hypothetical protein